MGKIVKNGVTYCGSSDNADNVKYNNNTSNLDATNVQGAIDELDGAVNILNDKIADEKITSIKTLVLATAFTLDGYVYFSPTIIPIMAKTITYNGSADLIYNGKSVSFGNISTSCQIGGGKYTRMQVKSTSTLDNKMSGTVQLNGTFTFTY